MTELIGNCKHEGDNWEVLIHGINKQICQKKSDWEIPFHDWLLSDSILGGRNRLFSLREASVEEGPAAGREGERLKAEVAYK